MEQSVTLEPGPLQQQTPGVSLGELVGLSDRGEPLVALTGVGASEAVRALTTVPLSVHQIGRRVVLAFEGGDRGKPVILGCVVEPGPASEDEAAAQPVALLLDDGRLTLAGEREIVFRCGKASITLTRAGKILVKGAYISSRSSGVHRIKGASVHVN